MCVYRKCAIFALHRDFAILLELMQLTALLLDIPNRFQNQSWDAHDVATLRCKSWTMRFHLCAIRFSLFAYENFLLVNATECKETKSHKSMRRNAHNYRYKSPTHMASPAASRSVYSSCWMHSSTCCDMNFRATLQEVSVNKLLAEIAKKRVLKAYCFTQVLLHAFQA